MRKRKQYKRHGIKQIALYADMLTFVKLGKEASERHRKLGPTVLAIVREYFEAKAAKDASVNPS